VKSVLYTPGPKQTVLSPLDSPAVSREEKEPDGQYYIAVNKKKREYICPCVSRGGEALGVGGDPQAAIFPALLAKTDEGGAAIRLGDPKVQAVFGRWAGDPVVLVGDYDSSKLYHRPGSHTRTSPRRSARP